MKRTSTPRTNVAATRHPPPERIQQIAEAITETVLEIGREFGRSDDELAAGLLISVGSVGYAAWGSGVIEEMRTAADCFELRLMGAAADE